MSTNGTTVTVTVTPSGIGVSGHAFDSNDSNAASAQFAGAATLSGNVALIYTYSTPVPEPSTTAFWMIGFSMCVLAGRSHLKQRGLNLS